MFQELRKCVCLPLTINLLGLLLRYCTGKSDEGPVYPTQSPRRPVEEEQLQQKIATEDGKFGNERILRPEEHADTNC